MLKVLEDVGKAIGDNAVFEPEKTEIAYYVRAFSEAEDTLTMFITQDQNNHPPTARWIDFEANNITVNAFPTFASHLLHSMFWKKALGVACFSATLRTLGTFDKFMSDSGIALSGRCSKGLAVQSDFNYTVSGLYLLQDGPTPNAKGNTDKAQYDELIAKMIVRAAHSDAVTGALVIFTSKSHMDAVASIIKTKFKLPKGSILIQGSMQRGKLLERHKKRVQSGKTSIIFGLSSFREGVDLPGDLCSAVIIPRLPFAVPNTPMEKARVAWIEKNGGNAFMSYALPACSVWLTQMVGRLIRTSEDRGTILILDNRILRTRYGGLLLNGLPPFERKRLTYQHLMNAC